VAELLADGDRHARPRADPLVRVDVLAADQVLAEIRMKRLEQRREIDRVGHVELGMEIDRPAAVAGPAVDLLALPVHAPHELEAVDDALTRIVGRMAIGAEACLSASTCRVLERAAGRTGEHGRVAFDVVARLAAEELP